MKLIKLTVRNIASYREAELDFNSFSYPVAVYGDNGAGKTTLFVDSITAALFGAAYGSPRLYKNFCGRTGYGEITLEFEVDNVRYKVVRRIYRDRPTEAYLYKWDNGLYKTYAVDVSKVNDAIMEIIGMDHSDLLNSIIIRQGEVERFIDASDADRGKILLGILKLDMENIEKSVYEKIKDLEAQIREVKGETSILEEEIKREGEIKRRIKEIKSEINELYNAREEINREIQEYENRYNSLDMEVKRLNRIIGGYETLITELNEKSRRLESLAGEEARIVSLLASKGIQEEYILALAINIDKLRDLWMLKEELRKETEKVDMARRYSQQLHRLKIELNDVSKEIDKYREIIDRLSSEKTRLNLEIKSYLERIDKLKAALATCPLCGAPLTEEHRQARIREFEDIIGRLRSNLASITTKLSKYETYFGELSEKKGSLEGEIKRIYGMLEAIGILEDVSAGIRRLEENIEEINEKISSLEVEINLTIQLGEAGLKEILGLRKELERYREIYNRKKEIISEIRELESKVSKYEDKYIEYQAKQKELSKIKSTLETKVKKLEEINNRIERLYGELEALEKRLEEIHVKRGRLEKAKEKLNGLEVEKEAYTVLKETFSWRGLPLFLLRKYLEIINQLTIHYIEVFGLPITMNLTIDVRGGKPTVTMKTYRDGIEAHPMTLSNGERVLLGFAIRLALNDLISGLYYKGRRPRFFIVDEGFGPLDAENRRRVAWALYNLLREGKYEQMIIISHAEGLWEEEIFKTRIEVTKEEGISRINIQHAAEVKQVV